jgi:hypothetical protein
VALWGRDTDAWRRFCFRRRTAAPRRPLSDSERSRSPASALSGFTSDIYQVVAYAQHARCGPAAVALVYPVSLQRDQQLPLPYRVTGFGDDVQLFFLDVGREAPDNLEAFRTILS